MKKILVPVLIAVFIAVMLFSAFQIVRIWSNYSKADTLYSEMQDKYVGTTPVAPPDTSAPETEPPATEPTQESDAPSESQETSPETVGIAVDFDALLAENGDIVGWLYCPDTPINYPVVQGEDNNEYLRSDLKGQYLYSGTIFVDYRNGPIGEDPNYLIYGHNMRNQTMFGPILEYEAQSYYDEHPVLYFLTPTQNYKLEPLAGAVVATNAMIYQISPDEEEFAQYMEELIEASGFKSQASFTPGDAVVTLSTCSYEYNTARYVLVCKLTEMR